MGKQVLGRLLLGGGLIVGLACSAGQAEVIKRVYPDGTVRYVIVHGVPSAAETAARLPPPRPEDVAATKEAVRTGTPPPITSQREEDGRVRVTVPGSHVRRDIIWPQPHIASWPEGVSEAEARHRLSRTRLQRGQGPPA